MITWLHKLLLFAIGISFSISAIEIDLGPCQNTFFDEYDSYVKEEQVSVENSSATQPEHETYASIYYLIHQSQPSGYPTASFEHQPLDYYNHYPPKLFVRNSVWRI